MFRYNCELIEGHDGFCKDKSLQWICQGCQSQGKAMKIIKHVPKEVSIARGSMRNLTAIR